MLFVNILICLAIVFISYLFWKFCQKVFFIRKLDGIPGPKTLPIIGSVYHFLTSYKDFLNNASKILQDYPSLCQIWVFSKLLIIITEPDKIKTILYSKDCMDKATYYKLIPPALGMGLLTAPASSWTRIRAMTAPTFSSLTLHGFFNTFVEQSVTLTDELKKIGLNKNIIIKQNIMNCTFRMACDSVMGVQLESHKNHLFVKTVQRLKNILLYRGMNLLVHSDIIFSLTAVGREQRKKVNFLYSLVDELIQQREEELNNVNTTTDKEKQPRRTFFDIHMDACRKENFTLQEIRDNIITMIITGSDTISTTIDFVIFMLANFPEIQEKVHKELLEIYGMETVKSRPIKYDDLQYMQYLERVIKETMRIFPTVPVIGRNVTKDLKIGEVVIPKDADILIFIIKIHRDERYWPNPLAFDPDRFLPERLKDNSAFYYFPFADGPRNCIGMKYGMMCMKVMLATLIRTYIFKVNKSIELDKINLIFDVVISPVEPFKVKIEGRSNKIL